MPSKLYGSVLFAIAVTVLWAGCSSDAGSSDADCVVGSELCTCTGGGGCDPGLTCASNRCVSLPGAVDGGGTDASDVGGSSDAVEDDGTVEGDLPIEENGDNSDGGQPDETEVEPPNIRIFDVVANGSGDCIEPTVQVLSHDDPRSGSGQLQFRELPEGWSVSGLTAREGTSSWILEIVPTWDDEEGSWITTGEIRIQLDVGGEWGPDARVLWGLTISEGVTRVEIDGTERSGTSLNRPTFFALEPGPHEVVFSMTVAQGREAKVMATAPWGVEGVDVVSIAPGEKRILFFQGRTWFLIDGSRAGELVRNQETGIDEGSAGTAHWEVSGSGFASCEIDFGLTGDAGLALNVRDRDEEPRESVWDVRNTDVEGSYLLANCTAGFEGGSLAIRTYDPVYDGSCSMMTWYLQATVDGAPIETLTADNVEVAIDGEPVSVESGLTLTRNNAARVSILLDGSYSIAEAGAEADVREAALAFVEQLPDETFFTISQFASEEIVPRWLEYAGEQLPDGFLVNQSDEPGYSRAGPVSAARTISGYEAWEGPASFAATKLYDAVGAAGTSGFAAPHDLVRFYQKVMLIFTDGQDTASVIDSAPAAVNVRLESCGVRPFVVGLGDVDEDSLSTIAGENVFVVDEREDIQAAFDEVAEQMRGIYRLRIITPTLVEDFSQTTVTFAYDGQSVANTFEVPELPCPGELDGECLLGDLCDVGLRCSSTTCVVAEEDE